MAQWNKILDGISRAIGGGDSLYAIAQSTQDIIRYDPGRGATKIGDPGHQFVAGSGFVAGISTDMTQVWRWDGNTWSQIGGPSNGLLASGSELYSVERPSGDLYRYNGSGSWTKIGGPAHQFVAGAGFVAGLSPSRDQVWRWDGGTWTQIGGPADSLLAVGTQLYAMGPPVGTVHRYGGAPFAWSTIGEQMHSIYGGGVLAGLSADRQVVRRFTPMDGWSALGGAGDSQELAVVGAKIYSRTGDGAVHELEISAIRSKLDYLRDHAPRVWLAQGEQHLPSSVGWASQHLVREKGPDGRYWLRTRDPLQNPTDKLPCFSGDLESAEVYGFWVTKQEGVVDLVYYFFFPYALGKRWCIPPNSDEIGLVTWGSRVGDWQHVTVRLEPVDGRLQPTQVRLSTPPAEGVVPWSYDVHGRPTVVQNGQALQAFWRREDGSLWITDGNSAQVGLTRGIVAGPPVAIMYGAQDYQHSPDPHVFWRHVDGSLWDTWSEDGRHFQNVRIHHVLGAVAGDPVVIKHAGALHVFWRHVDGSLWDTQWTGSTWVSDAIYSGGGVDSRAAALVHGSAPHVFWKHVNGSLWDTWYEQNRWNSVQVSAAQGVVDSAPAVVQHGSAPHVFWRHVDGSLWDTWHNAGGWHSVRVSAAQGVMDGVPAAIEYYNQPHVFWRHVDGSLWDTWYEQQWRSVQISEERGVVTGSPDVIIPSGEGRPHVFWGHKDGVLRDTAYTSGGQWVTTRLGSVEKLGEGPKPTHPVVYAAEGSHGVWSVPGAHHYAEEWGSVRDHVLTRVGPTTMRDKTSAGTAWDTWHKLQAFDFNARQGLGGAVWPSWMETNFTEAGTGDPTSPSSGAIYRWGNPHAGELFRREGGWYAYELNDGPRGPASRDWDAVVPQPVVAIEGTWTMHATSYRGNNGKRYTFTFPGGATVQPSLWGTDTYTDDSLVAVAAVHAGLITPQAGGTVTIEIRPGSPTYTSTTRHGVTSSAYGNWSGSYVFVL